jgi:hypothetical protein
MNSDAYSFSKSSSPQGVDQYTPYAEKQWNYINDINSGVYTTSNTLVQFDLTSIYNSGQFSDASDLFLTIPIVMQAGWFASAGGLVAPVVGHSALCALKTNFQHLVHQIEVVANGKVVNDTQPFISFYEHFKLISQMSQNDLKQFGPSLGFAPAGLDNEKSVKWQGDVLNATSTGLGLANNRAFGNETLAVDTPALAGVQNRDCINTALTQRATRLVDTSSGYSINGQGVYGSIAAGAQNPASIMSAAQLALEFKPHYSVQGTQMVWQDLAVIPLKYLCDCLDKMGLVKKLDLILRVYMNTGALSIDVAGVLDTTSTYKFVRQSSFVNTVPFTINSLGNAIDTANGGVPVTATQLGVGVYVGRSSTSQFTTTTGSGSFTSISHFMPACRCYYSLVKLEPSRALAYIEENRSKQVVYESVLFNQYSAIPASGSFSQLVQSGIKNPLGIAIIPFISPATVMNTTAAVAPITINNLTQLTGGEQYQSPYDTCPGTFAPLSLTNLQVALGGVNQLQSTLYYTFENFLEQVALAESLTSTDLGIGTGLISQSWWEMNRVYWVDLARGREADKASMRNLTISFNNNNNVAISLMVFTVYLDKFTIDVETGLVKK